MQLLKNKHPFSIILLSTLLGFFVDIKCVNLILAHGFFNGGEQGFTTMLYILVLPLIFITLLFSRYKVDYYRNLLLLSTISILLLYLFFTITFVGEPRISLFSFLGTVILGLLMPNITLVNSRVFIKSIMIIPIPGLLVLDRIFALTSLWVEGISMEASYAFMLPIIANIVYLRFYFLKESVFNKIVTFFVTLCNLVYLFEIIFWGSRGTILSILGVVVFLAVVSPNVGKWGVVINRRRLMILSISFVLLLIFFIPIVKYFVGQFDALGVQSRAFVKIMELKQEGDLSNGRSDLVRFTLNAFWESPLWGHGIDRFDANTGQLYPHNFILQTLYDGGVFLFLVLLVPFFLKVISSFRHCDNNNFSILCIFLFSSVPWAFLSEDMWEILPLWFFIGLAYRPNRAYKFYKKS